MQYTNEWWERESVEPVDEISKEKVENAWSGRMKQTANPFSKPWKKKNMSGVVKTNFAYMNRLGTDHITDTTVKAAKTRAALGTAASAAAAGAAGYAAYKGAKAAYKKYKEKKAAQNQPATANEAWIDDPAAQDIMESYFSEFADADCYTY